MDISGICLQRVRKQLLVRPPQRLELQNTPYNDFTQYQLNMRRKAEILKYGPNQTHTSKLTKAQKFANIVNGPSNIYSVEVLQGIINGNTECPNNHNLVPTLTSSCDVPGPVENIYLDNSTPIYNYINHVYSYSTLPVPYGQPFITSIKPDINVFNTTITELFVLYIDNAIPSPNTTFEFILPFTITSPVMPSIDSAFIYVYYNSTIMTSNDVTGKYVQGMKPVIGDVPILSTTTLTMTAPNTYTGILYVYNLAMYTTPGFIMDIKLLLFMTPKFGFQLTMNPTNGGGLIIKAL